MVRMCVLLAAGAALYAGYLHFGAFRSYSELSDVQLYELEREEKENIRKHSEQLDTAFDNPVPDGRAAYVAVNNRSQASLLLAMVREERSRRNRLYFALGLVGSCGLMLALILAFKGLPAPEPRFRVGSMQAPGAPSAPRPRPVVQAMTPAQAAEVLEVPVDAPRSAIEAALRTQLAARDPSQLTGLDPESQHFVSQQCEELKEASRILLSQAGPAAKTEDTPHG